MPVTDRLEDAATFQEADEILTGWLGRGAIKPGREHAGLIGSKAPAWLASAQTLPDKLTALAFWGRLWSLSSWRSAAEAADLTRVQCRSLVTSLASENLISEVAEWGSADERRFVSNAVELVEHPTAIQVGQILIATESARKATKATNHHLDCLRRRGLSMEVIVEAPPSIWRRLSRSAKATPNTILIMCENFATALAEQRWSEGEIGRPNLRELAASLTDAAREAPADFRENAARAVLSLLATYRASTPRRSDLVPGYEAAVALTGWFPAKQYSAPMKDAVELLLTDLERDIVGRLELGRPEGALRDLHRQIAGSTVAGQRLESLSLSGVDERAAIWLRTGKWVNMESGDADLAEAAAQDIDGLLADLLIDLEQIGAGADKRMAEIVRKARALGRARGVSVFGANAELLTFDPARHQLVDDALAGDGMVVVVRPGAIRRRATGDSVIVKATVRNSEF